MANQKKGIEFKVRKWSDTAKQPYDVIALDHDNNKQHYQRGVNFIHEFEAANRANILTENLNRYPGAGAFVREFWPIDGGIE